MELLGIVRVLRQPLPQPSVRKGMKVEGLSPTSRHAQSVSLVAFYLRQSRRP